MFTGLIETTGVITEIRPGNKTIHIGITPQKRPFEVKPGDSVACNGICLTVERQSGDMLFFTAVYETLVRTTLARAVTGTRVNLERAIRPSDRLGGHIVLGHVDGTGKIAGDARTGEGIMRTIRVPEQLLSFLAPKGSVAIDGVSLTIVEQRGNEISVSLVPFTQETTTLGMAKTGNKVNIECDVLARYVGHMLKFGAPGNTGNNERDILEKMKEQGF